MRAAIPGEPDLIPPFLVFNEAESYFTLLSSALGEYLREIHLSAVTKSTVWTNFSASRAHP
ncbi:MAG: hypothetical protein SV239_12755, partial [Thermodesulfobacteriota bacterium]|nr:hypothetical protein [Thermodesulfobacteriota bacterium]